MMAGSSNNTWEYRQLELTGLSQDDIDAKLRAMGIDSWELISVDTRATLFASKTMAYFKRKL